jgi:hypothetical protein
MLDKKHTECSNTNILQEYPIYISTHQIEKTINSSTIVVPGEVLMPGEKFVINNRKQYSIGGGKVTITRISGNYIYSYPNSDYPDYQKTEYVDIQQNSYKYRVHLGRKTTPILTTDNGEPNAIIYPIKQNLLVFKFSDNGADRETGELNGNTYVARRLSNTGYFSYGRAPSNDWWVAENGVNLQYTHERLKIRCYQKKSSNEEITKGYIYL